MVRNGENIYKRKDGRWEGRYIKGRKESGKILYGYLYGHKYTDVKKNLFRKKIQYQEFYYSIETTSARFKTLQNWIFYWLEKQKRQVKPSTYTNYRSKLSNHILIKIGSEDLMTLETEILQDCFDEMTQYLATSSIQNVYRILNTCLETAVEEGIVLKNPLKNVTIKKTKSMNVIAFSQNEQRRLEMHAASKKEAPILVALYTGLRIGELCALKWSDIQWESNCLTIQRNVQRQTISQSENKNRTQLTETSLKTESSKRTIPLTQKILMLFSCVQAESDRQDDDFIFTGKDGNCIDPRTLGYRFANLKTKAKIPDLPFHALRHTFATRCIEAAVPITTISSLLGHSSVKMTLDIYTNSFLSEKREAMEKMESLCQK